VSAFDPRDRVEPPADADERTMLVGWLDYHRRTLAAKCDGLTDEQLKLRSVEPSSLSLLGLVRHLTDVERAWFRSVFEGDPNVPHYWTDASPDGDFDDLDDAPVDEVFARWRGEHAHGTRILQRTASLDVLAQGTSSRGLRPSLRWVLTHLIEEYARHNGHADLIRERIDGRTGE
jgi:uncharacterized damage-inducible protein DinB